jgi:hypothetical protein
MGDAAAVVIGRYCRHELAFDRGSMSTLAELGDISALEDAELGSLLVRLEREERDVSKRRSRLHDRIDFVQAGGFAAAGRADEQLASLRATEREVSERRHVLHRTIDELRAERSRRRPAA